MIWGGGGGNMVWNVPTLVAHFCVLSKKYHVSCLITKVSRSDWFNKQKRQAFVFNKPIPETFWQSGNNLTPVASLPERMVISVSHEPRKRASGFTYPRWPPVYAKSSIPTILRRNRGPWIEWWTGHLMKDKIPPPPPSPNPQTITPILFQNNRPIDWDVRQSFQVQFSPIKHKLGIELS